MRDFYLATTVVAAIANGGAHAHRLLTHGTDQTVYDVPSNERGWPFNHICHRTQSDSAVGTDALAAEAHAGPTSSG